MDEFVDTYSDVAHAEIKIAAAIAASMQDLKLMPQFVN